MLCFAAPLAFRILRRTSDTKYEWDEVDGEYTVQTANSDVPEIAQKLVYKESEFDEQLWASDTLST